MKMHPVGFDAICLTSTCDSFVNNISEIHERCFQLKCNCRGGSELFHSQKQPEYVQKCA